MIGLGAKFLLTPIVGFGSVVGWAAFSAPNWDPAHVWRIKNKKEFYLTTCRSRREEGDHSGAKWIYSDLSIYLVFQEGSTAANNTELKLMGKGYHQKFQDVKPWNNSIYKYAEEDLQQKISNQQKDNRFSLSVGEETGKNWLGEGGAGEESSTWGLQMYCDKNLFTFAHEGQKTVKSAELSRVKFQLDQCEEKNYKGVKGCSITIVDDDTTAAGHNKNLKWADNFQPIVIIS
ncbi:hypothetical protein WEN_01230 [Mycoplasma wenyonii str. Massachusetts]|uniref:Uncharacterized protein n=1 Tax=Mycoplasma wenyonii (strain Massachusetts) TaxID=1197325 RepID=I6ZIN1_MYCWM|nr:hypothetical protein [Mycoplasma wenyonii]AFN65045.1 hypothetical protein WEN_01230 [Mycoplasma wenyonii str. Massachusetts]